MSGEPEYQDTPVGRLPVGPASDAALAAAAASSNGDGPPAEPPPDRRAVLRRAVPAVAAVTGVAITAAVVLWRRSHP